MSLIFFLASLVSADVDRLGCDVWADREAAQARLRCFGFFAVPALLRGASGESLEIRHRCRELLVPWQRWNDQAKAHAVLASPLMPDEFEFWNDERLRTDVFRMALANGCIYYDYSPWAGGFMPPICELTPAETRELLIAYREQLGTHRGDTLIEQLGFIVGEGVKP